MTVKLVEVYQDTAEEWRWRARAGNHEVVADSGEGYENRKDCVEMALALFPDASFPDGKGESEGA